jgi:hypothetical protein
MIDKFNIYILFIIYTLVIISSTIIINNNGKSTNVEEPVINMDYFKLMDIIDDLIDTYLQFKVSLDFNIRRDGKVIDFELEMKSITSEILIHISPQLMKSAEAYVSDTYMIEYISNRVQHFLLEKMKTDKK